MAKVKCYSVVIGKETKAAERELVIDWIFCSSLDKKTAMDKRNELSITNQYVWIEANYLLEKKDVV